MKKLLPILAVLILVISGIEAFALNNDHNSKQEIKIESITVTKPSIIDTGKYVKIDLEESPSSYINPGKPMIPSITKIYSLPFGSRIIDVDVTFYMDSEITLLKEIQPCPEPIPMINGIKIKKETIKDKSIYQSSNPFPQNRYTYKTSIGLNGYDRVTYLSVKCYPINYIPTENKILYSEKIDVKITYEKPKNPIIFPDEYDLVIITPNVFIGELSTFVDHKNSIGISTVTKTVEEIYTQYSGYDNQEKIKYFIKDAIETLGVTYVLLIGGMKGQNYEWYLPVRYTNNHAGKPYETGFISDLYYADIYKMENDEVVFEDWDSNDNNIFAEFVSEYNETSGEYEIFEKDILDCIPDVYLGRLPCREISELTIVIDKIIKYETNPLDPDWFNTFLLVAGDTYPNAEEPEAYEAEIDTELSASYMDGFEIKKLWTSLETLTGQPDVEREINNGAGFIHMAGHANPSVLVTNKPQGGGKVNILRMYNMPFFNAFYALIFQGQGIIAALQKLSEPRNPDLTNGNKQPIIVIGGCHNSQFNVTTRNILTKGFQRAYGYGIHAPKCFSWYLSSLENAGAIATMGNTGLGMGLPGFNYTEGLDGWLFPRFFYNYGVNGQQFLGEVFSTAISDYVNEFDVNEIVHPEVEDGPGAIRQMVEQWQLFGDPSLKIGGYQ